MGFMQLRNNARKNSGLQRGEKDHAGESENRTIRIADNKEKKNCFRC